MVHGPQGKLARDPAGRARVGEGRAGDRLERLRHPKTPALKASTRLVTAHKPKR